METEETKRRGLWWVFAAAGSALAWRAWADMRALHTGAAMQLRVFGSYWASGWAANHGLSPYGVYPLTGRYQSLMDVNLNPPVLLPVYQAFAWFGPNAGVKVWTLLSLLAYLGAVAALVWEYRRTMQRRQIMVLMLCAPLLDSLMMGQNYTFLAALAVAIWILLTRHRAVAAGIGLGLLVAAKPNFAVWPLFLLLAGQKRAAWTAAAVAVGLSCAPLAFYGPGVYGEWLRAAAGEHHWICTTDVSLAGTAARMGHRWAGIAAAVLLLAGSSAVMAWKRPSLRNLSGTALCVSILASPLAWVHYVLLLAGPLVAERWGGRLTVFLLFLLLPLWGVGFPLVCLLAAYFLWASVQEPRRVAVLEATAGAATQPA